MSTGVVGDGDIWVGMMTLTFDVLNLRCQEHNQLEMSGEQLEINKCRCENQKKVLAGDTDLGIIDFQVNLILI